MGEDDTVDVDGLSDVEGTPNLAQLQGLIRKILTQRFGLQLRHEQRELPVFALVVAKGGPRIVANTSDPNGIMDQQQNGSSSSRHVETLRNASMADLALVLQFHVDRPIVDHTGFRGRYDFKLQWTTDDAPAETPDAPPGLFTAIQEQIGLKLEPMKAPANVLVIEEDDYPSCSGEHEAIFCRHEEERDADGAGVSVAVWRGVAVRGAVERPALA